MVRLKKTHLEKKNFNTRHMCYAPLIEGICRYYAPLIEGICRYYAPLIEGIGVMALS